MIRLSKYYHFCIFLLTFVSILSVGSVLFAQEVESPLAAANIEDVVKEEFEESADSREMLNMPYVRLRSLDKITARSQTFDAQVGTTITFGNLYIRTQTCRQSQPIDEPESAAFLQIWESVAGQDIHESTEKTSWVFSGWMFASSPGLSHMDHPVYDVWVLGCLEEPADSREANDGETKE